MKQFFLDEYATVDMSQASFTGKDFLCESIYAPFIQITTTGASSLDYDFKIQGTSDINSGNSQPRNYADITEFVEKNITTNGTVAWLLPTSTISCKFIRIVGTRSAGSGTARIHFSGNKL